MQVGPAALADGVAAVARGGRTGEIIVGELHGRYVEQASRGAIFTASNVAAQALSLNSATATGLILSNPAGSGKLLAILEVCVAIASAPAGAATLVLTGNVDTTKAAVVHTTPLAIRSALLGGPANCAALADSAATLPAVGILRAIGGGPVAAGLVAPAFIKDEIAGALVLSPNTCVSLQCLTTAVSVVASITWEEIPLV